MSLVFASCGSEGAALGMAAPGERATHDSQPGLWGSFHGRANTRGCDTKYSRQESNLVFHLRGMACVPAHPGSDKSPYKSHKR